MITDKAWLIHQQARGDSSLSLCLFTAHHGLIRTYYKGGRHARKQRLPSFAPLWVELATGKHCFFIRTIEILKPQAHFQEQALLCAMYLNELLFYSLKQPEPVPQLFHYYEKTLQQLSECRESIPMAMALREFEWILLQHCGLAFSLSSDCRGVAIAPDAYYHFDPEYGFKPAPEGISGSIIIALANQDFQQAEVHRSARQIMRSAIDHLLEYRPVHSRNLLQQFARRQKSL
ncbi:MAG: DNA repair protein RecO C-terminal domain-containing protein [Legionellaceae bacterium]|nr:DNA repair protein RecO C-terminal domain-containing protein [Legionellaceae bacterium]